MEENKYWKENFDKLNTSEQIRILQDSYNIIAQRIQTELNTGLRSGNIDIIDIAYSKTSNGKAVFDVVILNKENGQTNHEIYDTEFDKINLDKINIDKNEINFYKLMYDTSLIEKDLAQLEGLKENPDKISLNDLKEIEKQVDSSAQSLGLSKEEVVYASTIDANHELQINTDRLGGSKFDNIKGTEKVSAHYNVNDTLNENYESYQIIKTSFGTYKLMGIDSEGHAQEIGQDKVEYLTSINDITLMQENGDVIKAPVLCAFRVKSQSEIDRDQVIGLCDNGTADKTSFYARGAITTDQMIGEQIPQRTHNEERANQELIMDTHYTPSIDIMDKIEEIADRYDMDPEDLTEALKDEYNGKDFDNLTENEIINVAEYESRIPNRDDRIYSDENHHEDE